MKRLLFIILLCLALCSLTYATTYYVANAGSDSNNGTSTGTPWQTISKVNGSTFSAGDSILFNKGDKWREQIAPPSSGSAGSVITFGAYGSGAKPIISGFDVTVGTFIADSQNVINYVTDTFIRTDQA